MKRTNRDSEEEAEDEVGEALCHSHLHKWEAEADSSLHRRPFPRILFITNLIPTLTTITARLPIPLIITTTNNNKGRE